MLSYTAFLRFHELENLARINNGKTWELVNTYRSPAATGRKKTLSQVSFLAVQRICKPLRCLA